MHADQNLWGAEHAKVPLTYGIRDLEVGVCARPGGRPQKTFACRPSDVLAGCSPLADDASARFQPLHANVRFGLKPDIGEPSLDDRHWPFAAGLLLAARRKKRTFVSASQFMTAFEPVRAMPPSLGRFDAVPRQMRIAARQFFPNF